MHTSRFLLGYHNSGDLYPFAGICLLGGGSQYPRRFNHNVLAGHGTEGSEAGFEKEVYLGIHVRPGFLVSPAMSSCYEYLTNVNFQCLHYKYDSIEIHYLIWNIN
jgi:hypothetical protein